MDNENVPPPPPFTPPPPPPRIAMPPAARQKRGGRGWMVFALILLVLFLLSVFFNFTQMLGGMMSGVSGVSHSRRAGPRLDEVLVQDNGASEKIALVEVEGVISSRRDHGGFDRIEILRAELNRAAEDRRVKAVLIKVNSPGGEVLASDEINRAIANFQKRTGKPVVVSMAQLAASGGYYISAPCDWIVANELTITGSIGVILPALNYRGLMDKVGLKPQVYKSGKFKDMLAGFRNPEEITPEEREMVQGWVDETYATFKKVVADGRGEKLKSDWEEYADGRILSGKDALAHGFIDELGNFDVALTRTRTIARINRANVIQYRQRIDFADLFSVFGEAKSQSKTIKIDVGLEMPELQAGQPYFLSPTYVQ